MTKEAEQEICALAEVAHLALSEEEVCDFAVSLRVQRERLAVLESSGMGEAAEPNSPIGIPLREDLPGACLSRDTVLAMSEGRRGMRLMVPRTVEEAE